MSRITILFLGIIGVFLSGCLGGGEPYADEDVAVAEEELIGSNALNLNALNLNALNLNALNLNALNLNALSAGSAEVFTKPDGDGPLARQLLKYLVECAFSPGQHFELSWTDGLGEVHDETYTGLMGLAPDWAAGAPTIGQQKWVSACLISRVNWYGTSVLISSRGSHVALSSLSWGEVSDFPKVEGAFWGNLFSDSPYARACYESHNRSHSRNKSRDCAAGHVSGQSVVECGIIDIVGSCKDRCGSLTSFGGYYESCDAGYGQNDEHRVITVWLSP